MTFYQELQLSSTGSKQLIRSTTDPKEKRRHILIYNFKVYLVMAFCVAVVSMYSKLTGSSNSVVGVTVLLAVLVLLWIGRGGREPEKTEVSVTEKQAMTFAEGEIRRIAGEGGPDNTWTAFHCRDLRYSYGRTPSGKYGASVSCVCSECCVYFTADDTGLSQCDHVQSFHLCAGISAASGL